MQPLVRSDFMMQARAAKHRSLQSGDGVAKQVAPSRYDAINLSEISQARSCQKNCREFLNMARQKSGNINRRVL